MCFAPQRSALFGHLNFQKWSERGVFRTFWLWNLFRGAHFDFETCFAPQRRAHFRHVSFQKWSENGVFWTCWLPNVLRATTPCNFSPLISLDGSAPAALASLLFDPPEPQDMEKHSVLRLFHLFAHLDLLSSDPLLSDSSHLCFSICPYCRKFDFKTPFGYVCNMCIFYIYIYIYI